MPKLDFNLENLKEHWQSLVAKVKKVSAVSGLILESAKILGITENALSLQFDSPTKINNAKTNAERLEKIFSDAFGRGIHLNFVLEEKEPPAKVEIKRKSLEEISAENPEIARFVEETGARLL